ncbi:inactive protein RESTRICTED TEV MOVEMENT 1-like [Nicotiana sylvestris]|uniref:inactive protein RESTRICTED TEV MOVEMENT 1-like n=1 Tax=Nicotiana sylvestris TaxID=4096 RepID=UPI00388CABBE
MDMIKIGPAGRSGGTIWDYKGRDQVAGVLVSYNKKAIVSLQFLYHENSKLVPSNKHGCDTCTQSSCAVVFDYPLEFLTSISGSFKSLNSLSSPFKSILNTIKFGTHKGSYGPFGTPSTTDGDKDFNFQTGNHRLAFRWFSWRTECSSNIESIGVYVKTIISPMINLKHPRVKSEKEEY